jgi:hypothetical protein
LKHEDEGSEMQKQKMIVSHILLISLFIIYDSWYLDYHNLHSNANEVEDKIDNAITRLARDAGVPKLEVNQKYFVRRQASFIKNFLKKSTKLK